MRVACCQLFSAVGEKLENLRMIREAVHEAARAGAELVVLPELANTGYSFADRDEVRAEAEPLDGPTVALWRQLSRELGIAIVAGFAELGDDQRLYNSAVLIDSDVLASYRKVHLWNREKELFSAGSGPAPVVSTRFGRIGVMICFDLEFPEWVRAAALDGADLLCAPVNWPLYPRPEGERPGEIFRVQANASVNRMSIAVADRAGRDRDQDWLGGSVVVDANGFPLANVPLGVTGMILADVDLIASRNKAISEHNDVHADRRPELYERWSPPPLH